VNHSYPKDLAKFVHQRWDQASSVSGDPAITVETPVGGLPPLPVLEEIISTCYQASLMRDEQRQVMLRLIVSNPEQFAVDDGPPNGLQPLIFNEYRLFSANELRRLSPAAGFYRSLVGINLDSNHNPSIWGIIQSGPHWLRALRGGRGTPSTLPPHLVLYITGPGRIEVNKGSTTVGQLRDGMVFGPSMNVLDSKWLSLAFASTRQELMDLHTAERKMHGQNWAILDPEVTRIIGQHTLKRIIASMRNFEHGGTLLIVPSEMSNQFNSKNPYLSFKYRFTEGYARLRFHSLMLKIMNTLASTHCLDSKSKQELPQVGWHEYAASQDESLIELDEGIFEMAHLIAGLSTVDGAVVMTKRFELLGFAGEIGCSAADVNQVARAGDLEADIFVLESTERVGTRHRSVYRFCNEVHDAIGIVVSQDGGVRIISWKNDRVTYWDHQATTSSLDF